MRVTKAMLEAKIVELERKLELTQHDCDIYRTEARTLKEFGPMQQMNTAMMTAQRLAEAASNIVSSLPTVQRINKDG